MKTIMMMARSPIYRDRGLIVPAKLLRHDPEPDLCPACAQGKPTIRRSHARRPRATKKGALWFFDVSGGGNRVPSLIDKNVYMYLFVDSFSRKYFPYYTKKKDDQTAMAVMRKHFEEATIGSKMRFSTR